MVPLVLGMPVRRGSSESAARDGTGQGLEDRLGLVMITHARQYADVQVEAALEREGLQEVVYELGRQVAQVGLGELRVDDRVPAAAEVYGHERQGLVEGDVGVAHPHNPLPVSHGLVEGSAKHYGCVLDEVMPANV